MDKRKCVYCNEIGDDDTQSAGRLLYFNIDEWAHVNCVLWSAEVYEDDEGRLQNALVALTRGRQMVCHKLFLAYIIVFARLWLLKEEMFMRIFIECYIFLYLHE